MRNIFKNKFIKLILYITYILFLLYLSISLSRNINYVIEKCKNNPIDYIKKIDDCYLTIHNFVSINSTPVIQNVVNKSNINVKLNSNQNFKTYIYSYTKPYIIELAQNSTKDCLCCS